MNWIEKVISVLILVMLVVALDGVFHYGNSRRVLKSVEIIRQDREYLSAGRVVNACFSLSTALLFGLGLYSCFVVEESEREMMLDWFGGASMLHAAFLQIVLSFFTHRLNVPVRAVLFSAMVETRNKKRHLPYLSIFVYSWVRGIGLVLCFWYAVASWSRLSPENSWLLIIIGTSFVYVASLVHWFCTREKKALTTEERLVIERIERKTRK